ncbi:unnamed protein product [Ectocarpus sp. CCAP 1310/34]|nr:unnamed protein product [Ectocarpus sp. CCAP 1310/34]
MLCPNISTTKTQDLLALTESSSSPARKMSLAVLAAILEHGRELGAQCGGTILDPALAALLRLARSDGDATVRSSAFDSIAKFIGQMGTTLYRQRLHDNDDTSSDLDDGTPSGDVLAHQQSRSTAEALTDDDSTGGGGGGGRGVTHGARATETMDMEIAPSERGAADHAGDADACPLSEKIPSATARTPMARTQMGAMHGATSGRQSRQGRTPVISPQHTSDRAHRATRGAGAPSEGNRGQRREAKVSAGPWTMGGALQSSLSAAAEALLTDGSKAVRAKALACSLLILEVHGDTIQPRGACCENTAGDEAGSAAGPGVSSRVERTLSTASSRCGGILILMAFLRSQRRLPRSSVDFASRPCMSGIAILCPSLRKRDLRQRCFPYTRGSFTWVHLSKSLVVQEPFLPLSTLCRVQVAKGALLALEALAGDNHGGSTTQASLNSTGGGGRHRKAADTARALLILPCVEPSPVELVMCYARCRVASGVGEGEAVGATEAKRALREIAQATFSADIRKLLKAVSVIMAADERRQGLEDGSANINFADTTEGASFSLSEVLGEVLAGVDSGAIASLLCDALEAYAAEDEIAPRDRDGETRKYSNYNSDEEEQLRTLAGSQGLFWRRLEQRMEDIERDERREESGWQGAQGDRGQLRRRGLGLSIEQYHGGGGDGGRNGGGGHGHRSAAPDAVSELSELLRIFQLLATYSLLSAKNSAALEALVFPAALSRRRLIVSRSIDIHNSFAFLVLVWGSRACDYVRLIGVLARENASFIAAHVREQYRCEKERREGNLHLPV